MARFLLISLIASLIVNVSTGPSSAHSGEPALLQSINLTTPLLDRTFNPYIPNYQYSMPINQETLTLVAIAEYEDSIIEINGVSDTDSLTVDIPIAIGLNEVTITVSADGYDDLIYTITVNRGPVSDPPSISFAVPLSHNSALVSLANVYPLRAFPNSYYFIESDKGPGITIYANSSPRSGVFKNLIPGETYRFRARSVNGNGSSAWSDYSDPITLPEAPLTNELCSPFSTKSGEYTILTFVDVGTCKWRVPWGINSVNALAVAGGGGGGGAVISGSDKGAGGGGGGGEVIEAIVPLTPGSYELISVGSGGAGGMGNAVESQNAANGARGGNTYLGSLFATGGEGGYGGTYNGGGADMAGDGGGSSQFWRTLTGEMYMYGRDSEWELNSSSCTSYPANDSDYAAAGCNYWEGAGGGVGAAGIHAFNLLYGTVDNEAFAPNAVLKAEKDGVTLYTASDVAYTNGGTGGSGGPGKASTLSGNSVLYGGGGGGGGSMGNYNCASELDHRKGQGGFGIDGGGDAAMCAENGSALLATAGLESTGSGGGGGGYVVDSEGTLSINAGHGASGGSGILIIRYRTADVTSDPNLPTLLSISNPTIAKEGNELVCKAGNYKYGVASDFAPVTPSEFIHVLYLGGAEYSKVSSSSSVARWKIGEITSKGLVTCETRAIYGGQSAITISSGNTNVLSQAASNLASDLSKADSNYENSTKNLTSNYKMALEKARKDWQASRNKALELHSAGYSKLISELGSEIISKREYVAKSKVLNRETKKKLAALWDSYLQARNTAKLGEELARKKASEDLAVAKAKAKNDYEKYLADAGYGITLG